MSIVFALERTNQLSLLPDKDLVDLCPPIEPYQVTKNQKNQQSDINHAKELYQEYKRRKKEISKEQATDNDNRDKR